MTMENTVQRPQQDQAYTLEQEPYYLPLADEIEIFTAAWQQRLPVLLKGPTGCGKTRFVEYMAHRIFRGSDSDKQRQAIENPLLTVSCHEDLSATDLVGRFLLKGQETVWQDGPLTRAVRQGSICYLDEVVEARKDSTVLIHSLTDHRRILPIEKKADILEAHDNFLLVMSYNPGYQNILKDLKPSTRQRFISIEFDYPGEEQEAAVIQHESGVESKYAKALALVAVKVRNLRHHGFDEGVSTRLLVYAGQLISGGIRPSRACDVAISTAVTDDRDVQQAIAQIVKTIICDD